jgi:hypothetical protein
VTFLLNGLSKFLIQKLNERFPTARFSFDVTANKTLAREYVVASKIISNAGNGYIRIEVFIPSNNQTRITVLFNDGRTNAVDWIWGGRGYPTPKTVMQSLEKEISIEYIERAFVGKTAVS